MRFENFIYKKKKEISSSPLPSSFFGPLAFSPRWLSSAPFFLLCLRPASPAQHPTPVSRGPQGASPATAAAPLAQHRAADRLAPLASAFFLPLAHASQGSNRCPHPVPSWERPPERPASTKRGPDPYPPSPLSPHSNFAPARARGSLNRCAEIRRPPLRMDSRLRAASVSIFPLVSLAVLLSSPPCLQFGVSWLLGLVSRAPRALGHRPSRPPRRPCPPATLSALASPPSLPLPPGALGLENRGP